MNKKILQLMAEHMNCDNASAPNAIGDAVYELLCDNGVDEQLAEKIADAAFELAATMVAYAGKYI
jgi:anti-sigma regulatory factor (Ser/Thr protein kinase)